MILLSGSNLSSCKLNPNDSIVLAFFSLLMHLEIFQIHPITPSPCQLTRVLRVVQRIAAGRLLASEFLSNKLNQASEHSQIIP